MSVNKCCCLFDLRLGVILIAAAEIILTLSAILIMVIFKDDCVDKITKWGYIVIMVYLGLCLLGSIPLIMGAMMMNKLLMLPWLLLNFVLLASAAVSAVILIILFPGGLALTCVALIIINGLILYFFQVVYSLYVDIEYEERLANLSSVKNKN